MTDEDFKKELALFAGHVEQKSARGIMVDVSNFRHKPDPGFMPWRVKNIFNRHTAAGVEREAFLFPGGAQIPPAMNQSAPGEEFLARGFDNPEEATAWLTAQNREHTTTEVESLCLIVFTKGDVDAGDGKREGTLRPSWFPEGLFPFESHFVSVGDSGIYYDLVETEAKPWASGWVTGAKGVQARLDDRTSAALVRLVRGLGVIS